MQIDLTAFKERRPSIAPLFDYIENAALTQMEVSGYSATIPYPDNLVNYNRLFLPLFMYSPDSKEFVSLLNLFADWFERLSFDYPNIALINMLINKHSGVINNLRKVIASDDELITFLDARIIEAEHIARSGITVDYHPDLLKMLSLTDSVKSCAIPIDQLKLPYASLYLDFRNAEPPIVTRSGEVIHGCYVQQKLISWDGAQRINLIEGDASLRLQAERGAIQSGKDIMMFQMLFIYDTNDPDNIMNNAFNIAASVDAGIAINQAVLYDDDVDNVTFAGDSFEEMSAPISMVINTIMYMNAKDSERIEIKEATGMTHKIKSLKKPSKRRKAEARIKREFYDYVRIGKQFSFEGLFERDAESGKDKKSPHLRLGHFHTYYVGERLQRDAEGNVIRDENGQGVPVPPGKREKEIKWVAPVLINASERDNKQHKTRRIQ